MNGDEALRKVKAQIQTQGNALNATVDYLDTFVEYVRQLEQLYTAQAKELETLREKVNVDRPTQEENVPTTEISS